MEPRATANLHAWKHHCDCTCEASHDQECNACETKESIDLAGEYPEIGHADGDFAKYDCRCEENLVDVGKLNTSSKLAKHVVG
jgi:hypothetical protein